ncbi:TetR/AcrR family transcriptional regulator [Pimelobacter simplex]|uniref:TetR/AcrR family transcriptional regulator n=1 Tax=Nocardioides simplex TaxID=2045 RepID=UPI00214FEFC4|nr:TetR/AcrR family transcriptional regulator [Pimelobacter simplex]UUW88852.1 TetR/AcrR family transcriptional regulator [Pimelobacter simplex]UUW98357.1 TetR/AcrR family transcriptional regulator [Pimelobacter simplex]
MARRKDQAARREHLIAATLTIIATHGLGGVTMKNIADEAGISPRLVAYYYPDLESLVEAAHQAATERYYWSRQRVVEDDLPPVDKLARLMHSGLPRGEDLLLSQVLDEISVNASRSPMHATLMTLLFDREVSLYTSVLEAGRAGGVFTLTDPADLVARNFVALEDALGLHLLAHNSSLTLERAEQQLASYAFATTGVRVAPTAPVAASSKE